MTAKMKSSQWSDFSQRVVRIHGLPKGSELRLYRKGDGRRVRSDFGIKRKAVNRSNITQLGGTDRISEFFADVMRLLSTDITARGFEMRLYGPDGDRIYGNTFVQTVRDIEPLQSRVDPVEIFLDVLEEAGIDDISLRQAGALYTSLRDIMGGEHFDKHLLRAGRR